jgi:hypothetical protein
MTAESASTSSSSTTTTTVDNVSLREEQVMSDVEPPIPSHLDEVLAEYMERVDRGETVDRERFLADHPDLAEELHVYFLAIDQLKELLE